MIVFENVFFKHQYDDYALLEGASFTLDDGFNTLLCDVQSGKTSICKLILGMLKPQSGEIFVDGQNVAVRPPDALFLPQNPTFFEGKSVLFNLEYPLRVRLGRKILPHQHEMATELAREFGLESKLSAKAKILNAEERRLLALARGLTVKRDVVLFDSFFDNNIKDSADIAVSGGKTTAALDAVNVAKKYFSDCKTIVQLTSFPQNTVGQTTVIFDKKCAFCGAAEQAREFVNSLYWLGTTTRTRKEC